MAETTIENPDAYRENAPVDDRGRVTIGADLAGENVIVVAEVVDDE